MAYLTRKSGLIVLLAGGALVVASGCGSGKSKKSVMLPGDAGAAGTEETAGGSAGSPEPGAAGEAGAPAGGAPGAAGAVDEGGAAGTIGEGGSAGSGSPFACVPSGSVVSPTLASEVVYKVCRGAGLGVKLSFNVDSSANSLTCCGVGTDFGATIDVLSNGDDGGDAFLTVPADAPLGAQALDVTCASGPVKNPIALEVTDTVAPEVLSVTAQIHPTDTMTVTGTHLDAITDVSAVSATGSVYPCIANNETNNAGSFACQFNGIPVGTGYTIVVYQDDCGYAVGDPDAATFEVIAPIFIPPAS